MGALDEVRARRALATAGVPSAGPLESASSVSNDVWLSDGHVVRMSTAGDGRLRREARLVIGLPGAVRYPPPIGHGRTAGVDWFVLERVAGTPLSRCWPDLDLEQRRAAIVDLASMLRALHHAPTPADAEPLIDPPQPLASDGTKVVAPVLELIDRACRLDHVDHLLLREIGDRVERHSHAVEPFDTATLIHGDLTFENMLWAPGGLTALIDFEYARGAPRDLDLDVFLRCCAFPKLFVAADYEHRTRAEDYAPVPWWLSEAYPEIFQIRHQLERVRLFAIAFDLRELLAHPPTVAPHHLPELHALNRLRAIHEERSYLDDLGRERI